MRTRQLVAPVIGAVLLALSSEASHAQARRTGAPDQHLPPHITQLAAFGERPAWSPDGKRIAFIGKSYGDAFEIDVRTRIVRLLSGHFRHAGLLRIQFLPNGDYFIIAARDFKDVKTTRERDLEMWVMKAGATEAPVALGHKIFEGVAISRSRMRVAWSNTRGQYPDSLAVGESVIWMADIEYVDGVPRLANKREVRRVTQNCTLEPQDFRNDDTELVYSCYRNVGTKADVHGVNLRTGAVTNYRAITDEYNEAEGVSPDGKFVLVESSKDQGSAERQTFNYLDIWRLPLVPNPTTFTRLTRFGDFEGYKSSNPVVSPDGRWFAFQAGRSGDPPGVGYGIFLYRLRAR